MYMLHFHVPESHVDIVKNALFAAGAGVIGNYSHCSWQIAGEGQFMPLAGSHAFVGEVDALERVPEFKVETVCDEVHIKAVIAALKASHPYEVPSYQVIKMEEY
jgi:structural hemagglutinin/hemolysin toxin protein RtxA